MAWEVIDKDKPLQPGDIVRLHFTMHGPMLVRAVQLAFIDRALENRDGFEILRYVIDADEPRRIYWEVRVTKTNPVIVTAAVIAGAIILSGVVLWLVLDKTEQLVDSPVGAAMGIGTVAVIGLLIFLMFKRK